ncbi:MAG: transporter substrate-binding protein [Herbinix sp.]|jgi:putative aldouronate transport system substrate-binding protein|nr:transporter substrate-binding protein [Herbinix sp.]
MFKKKLFAMVTTAALVMSLLAGCSNSSTGADTDSKDASNTSNPTEAAAPAAENTSTEFTYPMTSGKTLTYWTGLNANVSANYANLGDTPFAKAWMERTGVQIEFQHPPTGQDQEQFSLLLADGNLPDVIEYPWMTFPGGPEKAINDGVIISLNDVFEQYCPNLMAYLKANPEIDKMIKTDDGHYYVFPFIRGDEVLCNTIGLMVRQDWLQDLGLEVPTTIDEWHTVLTKFKEEKGATAPFSYEYTMGVLTEESPFTYAFGTSKNFYLNSDGTIHFGAVEDGYKQFLTTFANWYKEGLIDQDLATLALDQVSAKMTNGSAGASVGWAGSRMGVWIKAATATDPNYMLEAAPYPTLNKGDKPEFGQIENRYSNQGGVAITTSCEDIEAAARLLDYAYGEAGHMLFNFGIEGESYSIVGDYPTYTEQILNNPEGWPLAQSLSAYIRGNYNGPFVQDKRYLEQYYTIDSQKATNGIWGATNARAHKIPPITPTSDESQEFSSIMNEINTYRDEMTLKFIFGEESLDNFDDYVKNVESMGLARALEIENAALARYNAR